MNKLSTVIALVLLSLSSYGQMDCIVGEGACVGDSCYKDITFSQEKIQYTFQPMFREILALPETAYAIKGSDKYKLTPSSLKASWDGAEYWVDMTSDDGELYIGTLVLEQDFEMEALCERR